MFPESLQHDFSRVTRSTFLLKNSILDGEDKSLVRVKLIRNDIGDSQHLSCIKTSPRHKTFVSNRAAKISNVTENSLCNHISSESNPAGFLSRGLNTPDLVSCHLWDKSTILSQTDDAENSQNKITEI
ncbi:hypothetical protein NPIL_372671 [Nephila pilipes]|uniref:Uncharacterized protein n=1 Tax=Nephila pilipes TaxID=299642 RepID=A0A8X6UGU2_NEPPI|nr:hypothetical protein NPIL_372671 [Nephila pilipes]